MEIISVSSHRPTSYTLHQLRQCYKELRICTRTPHILPKSLFQRIQLVCNPNCDPRRNITPDLLDIHRMKQRRKQNRSESQNIQPHGSNSWKPVTVGNCRRPWKFMMLSIISLLKTSKANGKLKPPKSQIDENQDILLLIGVADAKCSGPLRTRAKSCDHEIVRAQKKVSKGRPNVPTHLPNRVGMVTDPQICDRALNQMLFQ